MIDMPLLNSTIQRLNEISTTIENKNKLSTDDESMIKQVFIEINKNGEIYWKFNNIENDKKSLVSWGTIIKNENKINDVIKSVNNKKCIK